MRRFLYPVTLLALVAVPNLALARGGPLHLHGPFEQSLAASKVEPRILTGPILTGSVQTWMASRHSHAHRVADMSN